MNDYTVLIPTTQKVVGITHITQEEKDVLPVVCITNELKPLDISNDYKNFVQNPTGIIEKFTNINSYRLDLTDNIETGESWQFGFAIAHLLHHQKLLSFSKQSKLINDANCIWATGKLNSNLDVLEVDHISKKIENSIPIFKEAKVNKNKLFICVCSKNYKDVLSFIEYFDDKEEIFKDIEILKIDNLKSLIKKTGLKYKITKEKINVKKYFLYSLYFGLVGVLFWFLFAATKITNNINKYYDMIDSRELHITLGEDDESNDFILRFGVFLFKYFQSNQRLKMNDFIQVKFDSENLKLNKKFSQNCKQYNEQGLKLFQTGCKIKIEVKNVSKQKLFLWVFKLKQNSEVVVEPSLTTSILETKDELSLYYDQKKYKKIVFVFGKNFNLQIQSWLNYLNKDSSSLFKQLKRISTSGYGYKVYEISEKVLIKNVK